MWHMKEKSDAEQVTRETFIEPFEAKSVLTRAVKRVAWDDNDEPDIMTREGQQSIRSHILKNGQDRFRKSDVRTTVTAFTQFENLFIVTRDAQYGICWGESIPNQTGMPSK